ncbi:actin depolymerizing protein [Gloeophyllum trabeum ATCC 11539]|uniref:Actin depolymerizing protein n=1 Tax=Gloeophyllum trabeum (strain ATCC 11539 / FP-39264 / Madison 617) TaxID=670483 RepID=S7QEW6_GLOTA|nr:actin depolymerizing protein [Gloeophyllum trabeum ATCC 11539]EPQ58361.1 actin depolymerizing protein [Gloeophyllum trabeum ATCC 11539]
MSATSGIGVSPDLRDVFAAALDSNSVRFIKVSIHNETLVHDLSFAVANSLQDDLPVLHDALDDNTPAYVLARLDDPPTDWLAIFYVPDSAKVRDKMLYASSRNALTKSLGSAHFTDSLFATSKADLTPEAYAAHKRHQAAPQPMSAREKEMADIRAAEREGGVPYRGSQVRQNVMGTGVGLNWGPEVEEAVKGLGDGDGSWLVVLTIDPATETLLLSSSSEKSVHELSTALPTSEPCYAFFAYPHPSARTIVFIYSCPSASPIKHRMLYSSGSSGVYAAAKSLLASSQSQVAGRKVETSDPAELTEGYLESELGLGDGEQKAAPAAVGSGGGFARPKGPGRRR